MANERTKSDRQTRQDIKEKTDDFRATEKSTREIKRHHTDPKYNYANSLVNADSFYANFTNMTLLEDSHSSLNTSYETEIPSLMGIFFSYY